MSADWRVCLQDLPKAGGHWRGIMPRSDLMQGGAIAGVDGLCDDVRFELRLARRGDVWRLSGEWRSAADRRCDRCTRRFVWGFSGRVSRDFRLVSVSVAVPGEDADLDLLHEPGRIDLLDVLREEMWLAWEARVVCDPRCKGLCPRCGRDLNEGDCACEGGDVADDHPFAALRRLKLDA
ncbi:MAG: DUF177 domain-containing protein [Mariprofundaceae bacterium]